MANTILTPTAVTRKALMILHQKLNFVGSINRQYDDQYATSGAKIGDSLKIRLPNQYTVRTGATLSAQDTTESSTTLQVATQKGVDVNFTSAELTMDMDDFSERVLEPAMAVLAANIEADAFTMYKEVYNQVNNNGSSATFATLMGVEKKLTDNLAPTSNRCVHFDTQANLDLVDALKGLFHDSTAIKKQYREGMMGTTAGFGDVYRSTLVPTHTSGTDDGTGDYLVDGAAESGAAITIDTGAGTLVEGDIITIAGVNRVHPETKADTGAVQQFVVTATTGTSATSVSISPSLTATGATQNVTNVPADNAIITKVGGASAAYDVSIGHHKDAFAFATADLIKPNGVDFCAREVYDGISMRVVRDYDINNDKFPCRLDILYGKKAIRPELATRFANN